jgi:GAF domain-containing protein
MIAEELRASKVAVSAWQPERGLLTTLAESGEATDERVFSIIEYPLSERVIREHEAVQVSVGDPESDPAEVDLLLRLGERSLLMVPVLAGGQSVGLIEVFRGAERPWTRAEINRARVIANQFAAVIPALVAR